MQTKASIIANSSTFSGFASNWKQETVKNFEILDMESFLEDRETKFDSKSRSFNLETLRVKKYIMEKQK